MDGHSSLPTVRIIASCRYLKINGVCICIYKFRTFCQIISARFCTVTDSCPIRITGHADTMFFLVIGCIYRICNNVSHFLSDYLKRSRRCSICSIIFRFRNHRIHIIGAGFQCIPRNILPLCTVFITICRIVIIGYLRCSLLSGNRRYTNGLVKVVICHTDGCGLIRLIDGKCILYRIFRT